MKSVSIYRKEDIVENDYLVRKFKNSENPNDKQVQELLLKLQNEHPFFTNLPKNIQDATVEVQYNQLQKILMCFQNPKKRNLVIIGEEEIENIVVVQNFLGNNVNIENIPKLQISASVNIYLYQPVDSEIVYQIYVYTTPKNLNLEQLFVLPNAVYILLFKASQTISVERIANILHVITAYHCATSVYLVGTQFNDPSSFINLLAILPLLGDIVGNLLYLSRDRSLEVVRPSQKFFEHESKCVWPVPSFPSQVSNQLIESVLAQLQQNSIQMMVTPPLLWYNVCCILFPHLFLNRSVESVGEPDLSGVKNVDLLNSARSCGFITQKELFSTINIGDNKRDKTQFIQFLLSTADIMYYQNAINIDQSLIILKPKILLSMINQLKILQSDLPCHIEYSSNLYQIPRDCFPKLSLQQSKSIAKKYLLPALTMREAFLPVSPKHHLFVDRIKTFKSKLGDETIQKFNQLIKHGAYTAEASNLVFVERKYECKYIPRIAISRLIAELWRQLKYYPKFQHNLLNENLIWENGLILTDTSDYNLNFFSNAICLIQWEFCTLTIKLSEVAKGNVESFLIPLLHRSIEMNIINELEVQIQIICSSSSSLSSQFYEECYDHLGRKILPVIEYANLRYLIPEYFELYNEANSGMSLDYVNCFHRGYSFELWYVLHNSLELSVKVPYFEKIPLIINEISMLRILNHPNIIRIVDITCKPPVSLITQYYECGNLKQCLEKNLQIHPIVICTIIKDICQAIAYLHNHSPPIIHCRILVTNILLKSLSLGKGKVCAILCDFTFSRFVNPTTATFSKGGILYDLEDLKAIINLLLNQLKASVIEENRNEAIAEIQNILQFFEYEDFLNTEEIAIQLLNNVINPFYQSNDIEKKLLFNKDLNYEDKFLRFMQANITDKRILLERYINELQSVKIDDDWSTTCQQVIPIFGCAIEENIFDVRVFRQLVALKFDFSQCDRIHQMNLFHYACKCANFPLVQLLKNYINPFKVNNLTNLPSKSAAIHLVMSSEKHPSNVEGLVATLRVIQFLVENGADINLQDGKGETALIKAAYAGSLPLVVHLIDCIVIDVNIPSNEKITAIIAAARGFTENHRICIKILLQAGSQYSSYLQVGNEELIQIQQVVSEIISNIKTDNYLISFKDSPITKSWQQGFRV